MGIVSFFRWFLGLHLIGMICEICVPVCVLPFVARRGGGSDDDGAAAARFLCIYTLFQGR